MRGMQTRSKQKRFKPGRKSEIARERCGSIRNRSYVALPLIEFLKGNERFIKSMGIK